MGIRITAKGPIFKCSNPDTCFCVPGYKSDFVSGIIILIKG